MRNRIFTFLLAIALLASPVFAVGTITQSAVILVHRSGSTAEAFKTITWSFVGDSANGSVPATGNAILSAANLAEIKGWYLVQIETNPGSTAPTDNWDVAVIDADGADILGSAGDNRDATNSEIALPPTASRAVDGAITVVISGNSVNSATGTVKLYFAPVASPGTVSSATFNTSLLALESGGNLATLLGHLQVPETNYANIASNGTTSVTLKTPSSTSSIVVDTFTIINADASNSYTVYLCDGACSTANWIPFRVDANSQGGGSNLKFSGTKNTLVAAKCSTDCTTQLTFGIAYHLVAR